MKAYLFIFVMVLLSFGVSPTSAQDDFPWPYPDMYVSGYLDDWRHDRIQIHCDGVLIQQEPVWIETHGGWNGEVYGKLMAQVDDLDCSHGSTVSFFVDGWPQAGSIEMVGGQMWFDLSPVELPYKMNLPIVESATLKVMEE